MNREQEIIKFVVEVIIKILPDLKKVYLFGSRAKGLNDANADFDFACDCKRPLIGLEQKVNQEVEQVSGLYKVDIVYLDSVDAQFKEMILNTGRVVYDRRA